MKKVRIDKLLVEREFASSRERAQSLIMAGVVLVGDVPATKPGQLVPPDADIRLKGEDYPYVSRGGVKLAHALNEFDIDVEGYECLDVGASTGGFTDCLLKHGARKVFAVDVGYGQLAWKLQKDPRVVVIERQNIRTIHPEKLPQSLDLVVIDVSFISLELVFPSIIPFLKPGGAIVALVKPQFEVGRELVGKGGIVKDPAAHRLALNKVIEAAASHGLTHVGTVTSPIEGAKGNKEFLTLFRKQ